MLLLFCLVTGRTQKAFQLPLSTGQFVNFTFRYHIVNSGYGDSKIFNTNILVKLAVAYIMIWCFILDSQIILGLYPPIPPGIGTSFDLSTFQARFLILVPDAHCLVDFTLKKWRTMQKKRAKSKSFQLYMSPKEHR